MTARETEVLELAIKWIDSEYAVQEAFVRQQLIQAIRMLKKERRDAKVRPEGKDGQ